MVEIDERREQAYFNWLETAWRGRRPLSPADWRDAVALCRALRSGVQEVGELRRQTGLSPARCRRAARPLDSLFTHLLEYEAASPSPATDGCASRAATLSTADTEV